MKFTPSSSARFRMSNDVFSSAPTLCMNDFSSASPKVIAPKQSSDTFTPDAPSFLYFMIWHHPFEPAGRLSAEAYPPRAAPHVVPHVAPEGRLPLPKPAKSGRVRRGGIRRDVGKPVITRTSRARARSLRAT